MVLGLTSAFAPGWQSPLPHPPCPACPAEQAAPAPESAVGVQPGTPVGGDSSPQRQRGDSSSSSAETAHAGGAEHSDVVPLLAAGSGSLAPGLRRRQGRLERR